MKKPEKEWGENKMVEQKRSLLDIHEEVLLLQHQIDYEEEMTEEQEITLSELKIEENVKLLSVAAWTKNLDMEIEGVTRFRDEVADRLRKLKALKQRLKQWIWKSAKMCGIVTGDDQHGYEGKKISSAQLQLSWRRSKETQTDESDPDFLDLHKNFPHFFDFKVRVTEEGGFMLMDLVEQGIIEIKEKEFRKSIAAKYLESKKVGIAGVRTVHKINPIIKG